MQAYDDLPKTVVKPSNDAHEGKTPLPAADRMAAEPGFDRAAGADLEFRLHDGQDGVRLVNESCASVDPIRKNGAIAKDGHCARSAAADVLAFPATALPDIGTVFLGFRLVGELGEGAFGKVYLAEQGDLANRPVALKVATNIVGEARTLAQLQHTHIVPIYSVHRAAPFQAVCMPYFGPTTLADVLREVRSTASLPASGKIFVCTVKHRRESTSRIDRVTPSRETASDVAEPELIDPPMVQKTVEEPSPLQKLEAMSYVEAVLSIGASLAD